mmetsp:Transcript_13535/g.20539  ORF Transcript_13535/g.20539 Transcript_13535/m.20539 type:complete len:347 (-) Transcript_13535:302-1342(-)
MTTMMNMIFSKHFFFISTTLLIVSLPVIAFSPPSLTVSKSYHPASSKYGPKYGIVREVASLWTLHATPPSSIVSSSTTSTSSSKSSSQLPLVGDDGKRSKSKGMTSLHFRGEKTYKSEPVPLIHANPHDFSSFFSDNEVRSLILNGDREDSIEILPQSEVSDKIFDLWIKQSQIVGGLHPSLNDDVVFRVNTGTINFSGLKIKSNSLIGVKYLEESDESNDTIKPEYQLVFIKDSPIVKGPRVLVWIYNQLTGSNKPTKDGTEKEQTVRAFSRFSYEATPDGKSFVFSVQSKLEVIVEFPSLLLKIMPVSKEKAEEQGSASVLKAMGKDIEAVLPKVRKYYLKTFE